MSEKTPCPENCHCAKANSSSNDLSPERAHLIKKGRRLEFLTVGWNIGEGLISVAAALAAKSIALLGFGIDSFVETASGLILLWRLYAEHDGQNKEQIERLDKRALRLVGLSLFLLAAYVAIESILALYHKEKPSPTVIGVLITSLSLIAMWWLARAKRRVAVALESRAMEADSFQTTACFWLSLITLVGLGLNQIGGWWWADPLAGLGMTFFLVREGLESWRGEDECGCRGGD